MRRLAVKRLTVYPLALKLKRRVSHAVSQRAVSEPVVVGVELMNGVVGYGETLPRAYVTGETNESVLALLTGGGEFISQLLAVRPSSFVEALEAIDALPMLTEEGQPCPAARAGVELALLDAYLRSAERSVGEMVGWLGLAGLGPPGSALRARYSIVLASDSIGGLRKTLRWAFLLGMRHFKLKVGFADDDQRLAAVGAIIGRALERGRASLRIDANGAWSVEQAVESLSRWHKLALAGVEQPLAKGAEEDLIPLRERTGARVYHDESLVTLEDAKRLHALGVADGFNIRISKCGGLMPALRLAGFARAHGIDVQLGCMVGETSILSAAGVRFLQNVPRVRFCEGSFGRLLMAEDVVRRSVRFRFRGRVPRISPEGLGAEVQTELLERHCLDRPIVVEL